MLILHRLIKNLSKLPGIGQKSAARLAYFLLKADPIFVDALSKDIRELKQKIKNCNICGNYTETDHCLICSDPARNTKLICIVEEPKDIQVIESIHEYNGLYHVLMGAISPIDGIGPENLTISTLISRIDNNKIEEIIIATNPTIEGDTTSAYITNIVKQKSILITKLALGLPVGGDLEYTDKLTVAKAFKGRNRLS